MVSAIWSDLLGRARYWRDTQYIHWGHNRLILTSLVAHHDAVGLRRFLDQLWGLRNLAPISQAICHARSGPCFRVLMERYTAAEILGLQSLGSSGWLTPPPEQNVVYWALVYDFAPACQLARQLARAERSHNWFARWAAELVLDRPGGVDLGQGPLDRAQLTTLEAQALYDAIRPPAGVAMEAGGRIASN